MLRQVRTGPEGLPTGWVGTVVRSQLPLQRAAPAPWTACAKGMQAETGPSARRVRGAEGARGRGERAARCWEGLTVSVSLKPEAAGLLQDRVAGEENGSD